MYAGDELYGDEITSGLDDDPGFRAFCQTDECLWSGSNRATEDEAVGELEDHLTGKHGATDVTVGPDGMGDIEEMG